jgi:outer membrane protein assembly factor BamB
MKALATFPQRIQRTALIAACSLACVVLPACSTVSSLFGSASHAPEAKALPANPAQLGAKIAWRASAGTQGSTTGASVQHGQLLISNAAGEVLAINPAGQIISRTAFGASLTTAPGFDGTRLAALTQNNDLLVFAGGKELWRQRLPAQSYTAPVVAGERVFVLLADRSVMAFDGATGGKLWVVQRNSSQQEALNLQQAGVLLPVGDVLVVGVGHNLQGLDPDSGRPLWVKAVASPRSTNDVERLSDVVAPAYRDGNTICARAYQVGIACVDSASASLQWSKPSQGQTGVSGNKDAVFVTDSDGRVRALGRERGLPVWSNDQFLLRHLSNPVTLNGSVAFGDTQGRVYFLSAAKGELQEYQSEGSAAIQSTLVYGGQVITLSSAGSVTAWRLP